MRRWSVAPIVVATSLRLHAAAGSLPAAVPPVELAKGDMPALQADANPHGGCPGDAPGAHGVFRID